MEDDKVILILQKEGITTIVRDFIYPFTPTIYYQRFGLLGVDMYQLDHQKGNIAYYKYVPLKGQQESNDSDIEVKK